MKWRPLLLGAAIACVAAPHEAVADAPVRFEVWADRDDDDADGKPDAEADVLGERGRADMLLLDRSWAGAVFTPISGGEHARVVVDGKPIAWGKPLIPSTYPPQTYLQGVSAGLVRLASSRGNKKDTVEIFVRGVALRDGANAPVDLARSNASLERTPPARMEVGARDARHDDPDALRVVMEVPDGAGDLLDVAVESVTQVGQRTDLLPHVPLGSAPCLPARPGVRCFVSVPLRFVIDEVDRTHPLVAERSLRAEMGGAIVVRAFGKKAQAIRVLGPRATAVGPIKRLQATLRPFVVRVTPGGAPAIGGNDAGAVSALRAELVSAAAIWGQCGLTFGEARTLDVKVVDPPPAHLVAIGDDMGLAASGGDIKLKVDGRPLTVAIPPGATPDRAASDLVRALEKLGMVGVTSPNARIAPGASGSVDVSVRRKDGSLASVDASAPGAPLSTDPTLSVRVGTVDLTDGLQHFTDMDAMAGTLEERTLLKALDDGNPQTLEVVIVPMFAGGGRIGESFIGSDLSSLRNVVLLDRAGIRARKSSLTLAHELGHVLMDMPGHPDDYGVDTPTLLMDSDAADASPFGPRRLTLEDCARVVRQAGPKARVPLLTEWPLGPLPDLK